MHRRNRGWSTNDLHGTNRLLRWAHSRAGCRMNPHRRMGETIASDSSRKSDAGGNGLPRFLTSRRSSLPDARMSIGRHEQAPANVVPFVCPGSPLACLAPFLLDKLRPNRAVRRERRMTKAGDMRRQLAGAFQSLGIRTRLMALVLVV